MSLNRRKIAIIGAGHVGSHGGYALISQGLAEEIVYIDIDQKKAEAQALDLFDSSTYLDRHVKVYAGNYSDIKDADILIVAAGPLPDMKAGQNDRQQTLGATVEILKDIVPKIKASGFDGIIINISNPADVVPDHRNNLRPQSQAEDAMAGSYAKHHQIHVEERKNVSEHWLSCQSPHP